MANLEEAELEESTLFKIGITIRQLCKAKTLYKAELDEELNKKLKEKCPAFLEKQIK